METDSTGKAAFDAACAYLARRAHGRQELRAKLVRKGFLHDAVESALERLSERGYINDEETALRWARELAAKRNRGSAGIAAYLARKGIAGDVIDIVQQTLRKEFSEQEGARRALDKRFSPASERPTRGKAAAFLRSRGFPPDVIYSAVREYCGSDSDQPFRV